MMSGTVELPAGFQASSIISLGSGTPYHTFNCLAGFDRCVISLNSIRPEKQSFLGLKEFAYRSVDLRLGWDVPRFSNRARVSLIGEAFNMFNFDNNGCLEAWAGEPGNPRPTFMQPTCQFNTQRFQVGARVAFGRHD